MAILKIVKYGDKTLRQKTRKVTKLSKKIITLIEDMFDTMYANNGVGLAAPQVGSDLRLFVIDCAGENERPMPIVFINPVIIKKTGGMLSHEGCLSFPNVYTDVRRYSSVLVKAEDINGKTFTLETPPDSLISKAIQHEFDHLNGILFIDHARDVEKTNLALSTNNLKDVEVDNLIEENEIEAIIKTKNLLELKDED